MAARITFEDDQWTNVFCEGCKLTHKVLTAHKRGRWECPYCDAAIELCDVPAVVELLARKEA